MPPQDRQSLVNTLLAHLPEQSSPAVIVVRPDRPTPAPIRTNGHRANPPTPAYDPSIVFILELVTIMATRDRESVTLMGQSVTDALQAVVRDATNVHHLVLSRAVYYLLNLLYASQVKKIEEIAVGFTNATQEHSFVRAPVILHTISGYDSSTLEKAAMPVLKGLALCITEPTPLRNEITNIPDFWVILRSLRSIPDAASGAFALVADIVTGQPAAVTADNYEETVRLLNDFASAGSIGAMIEQKRDKSARNREKHVKVAKPR